MSIESIIAHGAQFLVNKSQTGHEKSLGIKQSDLFEISCFIKDIFKIEFVNQEELS